MKIATLDLGSNTFLLLICDVQKGKITKTYCDEVEIIRMAEGVDATKKLNKDTLSRIDQCFEKFRKIIDSHNVDKIVGVATSAARDVSNSDEFFSLCDKWNFPVEIIEGEREAKLTYAGVFDGKSQSAVIDVGGGSTEIIQIDEQGQFDARSVDIGAVRLYEKFVKTDLVDMETLNQIDNYIYEQLRKADVNSFSDEDYAIAVAGTPTTLASMIKKIDYDKDQIEGFTISLQDLDLWRDKLAQMPLEQRKKLPGLPEKRADIILVGVSILSVIVNYLGLEGIKVSTRGVRYGLALES